MQSFSETFLKNFSLRSVSENWIAYKEKLTELTHAHIPRTRLRVNISKLWFHMSLLTLKNKKKSLFQIAKCTGTEASWKKHKEFEKEYCNAIRSAKKRFYLHDLPTLIKNNPRKFWQTIAPPNTHDDIALLHSSGNPVALEDCSGILHNYFTAVFTKEDHSNMPLPPEVSYQYMAPILITSQGISSLINKLKLLSSSGTDNINLKS